MGQGEELQELELDGSLVYTFKSSLHQPPGACIGALRLWALVESMTEAARCWALRLCLRFKWRKVHLGKGVQAKAPQQGGWSGPETPGSKGKEAVLDRRTVPGATGLAAIRAHQSRGP